MFIKPVSKYLCKYLEIGFLTLCVKNTFCLKLKEISAWQQGSVKSSIPAIFIFFFLRLYLFIFREGKGGRERGREISVCSCLSRTSYWCVRGNLWPATQACAQTGNGTRNPCPGLSLLSHFLPLSLLGTSSSPFYCFLYILSTHSSSFLVVAFTC